MIVGDIGELLEFYKGQSFALLSFQKDYTQVPAQNRLILSKTGNLDEAAQNLFSSLRLLDRLPVDYILTEYVPGHDLGLAINDRLKRAAAK